MVNSAPLRIGDQRNPHAQIPRIEVNRIDIGTVICSEWVRGYILYRVVRVGGLRMHRTCYKE
jgi:hypothetical protein